MNRDEVRASLSRAPKDRGHDTIKDGASLWLPMPDGDLREFVLVESSVMEPELAARFPEIKTYQGVGVDDSRDLVRVDINRRSFHAQVLSPRGNAYVDPVDAGGTDYLAYYATNAARLEESIDCLTDSSSPVTSAAASIGGIQSDGMLRVYRLAVAATGEYTQFHGGTVEGGLSAIATAVNRLNGIYESELSIRFVLVANNDRIVFTNSATDYYSNTDGVAMLSQNQSVLDALIGSANYDIGHVFSTGGGGIAQVGSVCVSGSKAKGVTGRASPVGDSFYVDYVAHEIAHQFGAHHTFNGVTGSCSANNRYPGTAYEPGSGSTIMSYSGICGTDNLQYSSDAYFHAASLVEIENFIGSTCPAPASSGNLAPTVDAGADYVIPAGTPFELTATGDDPDGDLLTYCWEQIDLGDASALLGQDVGNGPLFRSFPPVVSSSRTFPSLPSLLSNFSPNSEVLPTTSRSLNFRVTARDTHPGGGAFAMDDMQVTVVTDAGPFVVVSPNSGVELSGLQEVVWNVSRTDLAPVGIASVDILLSTNGGFEFPILLATNTPNDGTEQIVLPEIYCRNARIKVRASGSIFFDISDMDFTIVPQSSGGVTYVVETNIFSNTSGVMIPASGTKGNASQFPMSLSVTGMADVVETVSVDLHGLSHSFVDDLDVLLVGPNGVGVMLMSDCSGGAKADNLELSFDDAAVLMPGGGSLGSGQYQPLNVGTTGDTFPVAGPYGNALSAFAGIDPNGEWSLYIVDDSTGDAGVLSDGWTLNIVTRRNVMPTNEPPIILAQPIYYVHAGGTLVVTNQAVDPDNSGELTFSLRPDAPAGVQLDAGGVLVWVPDHTLAGTTNRCTIQVSDSGSPAMVTEEVLQLVVVGDPNIHSLTLSNGLAVLEWSSIPGARYRIESTDDLASANWTEDGEVVIAGDFTASTGLPTNACAQRFFRLRVGP